MGREMDLEGEEIGRVEPVASLPGPSGLKNVPAPLEHFINCNSLENGSDTPDFILGGFLADVLAAYDKAVTHRERWYGRKTAPAVPEPSPAKGYPSSNVGTQLPTNGANVGTSPTGAQPGAAAPLFDGLEEKIASELESISAQREHIVRAFIAQHGFNPDEAEQVVQHTEAGTVFYIRKRAHPPGPSQDSQEVRGKVADMIWAWTSAALNSQQSLDLADRILALLPQSPKGGPAARWGNLDTILEDMDAYLRPDYMPTEMQWKLAVTAWRKALGWLAGPASTPQGAAGAGDLEQAWAEIRDTMADSMLNVAQKKAFVLSILKGQLAHPPEDTPAEGADDENRETWICLQCGKLDARVTIIPALGPDGEADEGCESCGSADLVGTPEEAITKLVAKCNRLESLHFDAEAKKLDAKIAAAHPPEDTPAEGAALYTRKECQECKDSLQSDCIGALPCPHCSGGFIYTEVAAPGTPSEAAGLTFEAWFASEQPAGTDDSYRRCWDAARAPGTPSEKAAREADERKAFEAWYYNPANWMEYSKQDGLIPAADSAWNAWRARASLSSLPQEPKEGGAA